MYFRKIDRMGRMTLPKKYREKLGIKAEDILVFSVDIKTYSIIVEKQEKKNATK